MHGHHFCRRREVFLCPFSYWEGDLFSALTVLLPRASCLGLSLMFVPSVIIVCATRASPCFTGMDPISLCPLSSVLELSSTPEVERGF